VLWQLPPQMKPDLPRLRDFLQALPGSSGSSTGRARGAGRLFHVVELHSAAWYGDEVYRLLEDEGASLCLHDLLGADTPPAPWPPPGPIYYRRFHGVKARYSGRYGPAALAPRAAEMGSLARAGVPCFAYFNNDAQGFAVSDALDLLRLLGGPPGGQPGATRLPPRPGV